MAYASNKNNSKKNKIESLESSYYALAKRLRVVLKMLAYPYSYTGKELDELDEEQEDLYEKLWKIEEKLIDLQGFVPDFYELHKKYKEH
jgi:hypothetical protein